MKKRGGTEGEDKTKHQRLRRSPGVPHSLTYEVVGFPNIIVPHCNFQGLLGQITMFYLIAKLLSGSEDRVRMNCAGFLPGLLLFATRRELNLHPSPSD